MQNDEILNALLEDLREFVAEEERKGKEKGHEKPE